MKTFLTLIRHAKTEPFDTDGPDEQRKLLPRGITDAKRVGEVVLSRQPRPDLILASTARRVRETVKILQSMISDLPHPEYTDGFYLADAEEIWALTYPLVREYRETWVVAHNPGIQELIGYLTGTAPEKVPTMGVARIAFSEDNPLPGNGTLELLTSPKHL